MERFHQLRVFGTLTSFAIEIRENGEELVFSQVYMYPLTAAGVVEEFIKNGFDGQEHDVIDNWNEIANADDWMGTVVRTENGQYSAAWYHYTYTDAQVRFFEGVGFPA